MSLLHLQKDPSKTISWAKGTSTELFIYPKTGNFQKREFLFRLSLATVEAEESVFTPLPGIHRTLMLLEGEHTLSHENHHKKMLKPFDQDSFSGDWHTTSQGKAINFNLMCMDGAKGQLNHLRVAKGETFTFEPQSDFTIFYLYSGSCANDEIKCIAGDCLVWEKSKHSMPVLKGLETCTFVQVSISLYK